MAQGTAQFGSHSVSVWVCIRSLQYAAFYAVQKHAVQWVSDSKSNYGVQLCPVVDWHSRVRGCTLWAPSHPLMSYWLGVILGSFKLGSIRIAIILTEGPIICFDSMRGGSGSQSDFGWGQWPCSAAPVHAPAEDTAYGLLFSSCEVNVIKFVHHLNLHRSSWASAMTWTVKTAVYEARNYYTLIKQCCCYLEVCSAEYAANIKISLMP